MRRAGLRAQPIQHRRPGLGRGQPLAHREVHQQAKNKAQGPQLAGLSRPMSRCRWPTAPGSPPPRAQALKGNRDQRPGHDRLHASGDPPPPGQDHPASATRPRSRLVLVPPTPNTPVPGPRLPLPTTQLHRHLNAVAVLSISSGSRNYYRSSMILAISDRRAVSEVVISSRLIRPSLSVASCTFASSSDI